MSYMITLRNADGGSGVGNPRYLTIDDATGQTQEAASGADWAKAILGGFPKKQDFTGTKRRSGDILFLVHGFNVSHDDALKFHHKCREALQNLGWQGQLISYDWPSDGLVFAYLPDRANARASASALVQSAITLLESTQQQDCAVNVHVMAHSMGAFVTQQAFTWSYQDVPPGWKVGQVLLVAGDVDATVFSAGNASATAFVGHAGRLTSYSNSYDKALLVSNVKRAGFAARVGRVGLPGDSPAVMVGVDCSDLFEATDSSLLDNLSPTETHSFYFDRLEFWRDVVLTLAGGLDRSVFPTRDQDTGTTTAHRFVLKSADIGAAEFATALQRATTG